MTDVATITLADTYDALKVTVEKAAKAKDAAVKAEQARQEAATKEIQKLVDAETKAVQALAKAGAARLAIHRAIPTEIAVGLENAEAELRQHTGALEGAKRILAEQEKHHEKIMARVATFPVEKDPATGKEGLSPRAAVEKKEGDEALKKAKDTLKVETDRVATIKAKIAKLEKDRSEFVKEIRARAEKAEKAEKSAK